MHHYLRLTFLIFFCFLFGLCHLNHFYFFNKYLIRDSSANSPEDKCIRKKDTARKQTMLKTAESQTGLRKSHLRD